MQLPVPLTSRVYLLAYNTDKHRLTCNGYLGYVLRAAALTELHQAGALSDVDGKVKPGRTHLKDPLNDPVLVDVLQEISGAPKLRSWAHWVRHAQTPMFRAVQQRLVEQRLISTERYRILGIFPATRVRVLEHRAVRQLRSIVSRALAGGSVEPPDGALPRLPRSARYASLSVASRPASAGNVSPPSSRRPVRRCPPCARSFATTTPRNRQADHADHLLTVQGVGRGLGKDSVCGRWPRGWRCWVPGGGRWLRKHARVRGGAVKRVLR